MSEQSAESDAPRCRLCGEPTRIDCYGNATHHNGPGSHDAEPIMPSQREEYVPERGYWIGPTLDVGEKPWPLFWEQRDNDACAHEWQRVVVTYRHRESEPVVRCRRCHVPRCGDSTDRDPCMERRHHRTVHLTLSGLFEPVGGYLRDEA